MNGAMTRVENELLAESIGAAVELSLLRLPSEDDLMVAAVYAVCAVAGTVGAGALLHATLTFLGVLR